MSDISSNNKRIAKNTLLLYIRMMAVMGVSIYTTRVYLDQLGVSDYGIYNIVGGVVGMLTFFSNSMSTTTMRYITVALGERNIENLKKTFAGTLNIHILFAFCIVVLLETIGLWFVNNKLVIPIDRLTAVNWVYQFSILSTFIGIIQIPYNSTINAHEDMGVFAWLAIFDVLCKLGIAYLLLISPIDKLIFYSLMLLIINFMIFLMYNTYCYTHYKECRFKLFIDKKMYKSMASFSGWYMLGGFADICREEGVNIILNLFFGTLVNAARAVAVQVSSVANGFMYNFLAAAYPQTIKYYAEGDINQMQILVNRSLKFSFLLIFLISVPLMLNIDFILDIWLKEVPNMANIFMILICLDFLFKSLLGTPFSWLVAASGKVRNEQIFASIVLLMIIPVSYVLLKSYPNPIVPFVVVIIFNSLSGIVRLYFAHQLTGYSIPSFVKEVLRPTLKISLVTIPISVSLRLILFNNETLYSFILSTLFFYTIALLSCWIFAFDKNEKETIVRIIQNKNIFRNNK